MPKSWGMRLELEAGKTVRPCKPWVGFELQYMCMGWGRLVGEGQIGPSFSEEQSGSCRVGAQGKQGCTPESLPHPCPAGAGTLGPAQLH